MRISTLKLTIGISFFVCMVAIYVICCLESLVGALLAGALWVLFYFVMKKKFARCPYCKKPLGKDFLKEDTCPHCGEQLD